MNIVEIRQFSKDLTNPERTVQRCFAERERERERESERERCSIYNFTKEEPLTNLGEVKKNQSSKGAHEYNFSE